MGLEKVIDEILAAGEERRRKILEEGDAERQRILSSAKAEAESVRKERIKESEQRTSMTKQQSLSSAELEAKKRLLKEQNALLIQAKGEVLKSLSALADDARKDILGKLSKIAAKQLSKGVIHCRKEDEKIISVPPGFKKATDLKASGGILAESEEGDYRMDLTFEVLLDDIWNKDVRKVYEIMFGGA
jgi:V/A-type H+/Na+-transporting ATPase subunit E